MDFITKAWVLNLGLGTWFPRGDILETSIFLDYVNSFFNLVLTKNTGVSFSFLNAFPSQLPLIIFTGLIIGWLVKWLIDEKKMWNKTAIVFVLAGALGNLIDRIRFGGVIDFLDVHYGAFHWPAFNGADVFISIGAGIYILGFLIKKKK